MLRVELAVRVGDLAHEDRRATPRRAGGRRRGGGEQRGRLLDPGADERVGVLRPGDRRPRPPRATRACAARSPGASASHHRRALLDRPRHRPGVVEARREREAALERDEPVGRLEADDAAARGRDPDRAAGVRAERGVGEPGGERGGRAAARPAGDAPGRERVRHVPVVRVLRGRPVGELVQVRLADVRVAGRLEPPHRLGGLRRDVLGEDRRAVRRRQAGGVEEVLDGERDPARRARRAARGRSRAGRPELTQSTAR